MGYMKELWQQINDMDEAILLTDNDELYGSDSELLKLVGFFHDIDRGVEMFKKGVTLKQIEEEYDGIPADYVYHLLKE